MQLKQRLRINKGDTDPTHNEDNTDLTMTRAASVDEYLATLTDIEREASKLRDENTLLMQQLVEKKVEYAMMQEEFVKTRRSLIRAVERQAHLSKKIDDIRDGPVVASSGGIGGTDHALVTVNAKRKLTMFRTGRVWSAAVSNGTR